MTREERISALANLRYVKRQKDKDRLADDTIDICFKALEQESCEDAISRQAVLDAISKIGTFKSGVKEVQAVAECLRAVEALPPVTAKPKTGHWIEEDMFDGDMAYRCSECDELFWIECGTPKDNEYNFCPKCGVNMESEE